MYFYNSPLPRKLYDSPDVRQLTNHLLNISLEQSYLSPLYDQQSIEQVTGSHQLNYSTSGVCFGASRLEIRAAARLALSQNSYRSFS